jgi:hypothetical protein
MAAKQTCPRIDVPGSGEAGVGGHRMPTYDMRHRDDVGVLTLRFSAACDDDGGAQVVAHAINIPDRKHQKTWSGIMLVDRQARNSHAPPRLRVGSIDPGRPAGAADDVLSREESSMTSKLVSHVFNNCLFERMRDMNRSRLERLREIRQFELEFESRLLAARNHSEATEICNEWMKQRLEAVAIEQRAFTTAWLSVVSDMLKAASPGQAAEDYQESA